MGKRIIARRRGRGNFRYRAPSHRYLSDVLYKPMKEQVITGKIIRMVHCPGHSAPLAKVRYDDGTKGYIFTAENMFIGDRIEMGKNVQIKLGNTLLLGNIPEGTNIFNIEGLPGDGGKFVRSAGVTAKVLAKTEKTVTVEMPSKKKKDFSINCRATVGIIAGGGKKDKPFVTAGNKYLAMRARGRLYPKTAAVAMNPNDHPFGSGRGRHEGKSTTSSKWAPPGRKVGQIGARRTGRKR